MRDSQDREQRACAEAETQRQRFNESLIALPAQVAVYSGSNHVYAFVNSAYQRYVASQAPLGRFVRDVVSEAEKQGVFALMDRVFNIGEPQYAQELEVWLDLIGAGTREQVFLSLCLYPLRNLQEQVDRLLDFSYDVTE